MKALKVFSFLLSLGWPQGYLLFCASGSSLSPRSLLCTTAEYQIRGKGRSTGQTDLDVMIIQWASAGPHPYSLFIMLPTSSGFYLNLSLITTSPTRLKQHLGGILAAELKICIWKQWIEAWWNNMWISGKLLLEQSLSNQLVPNIVTIVR